MSAVDPFVHEAPRGLETVDMVELTPEQVSAADIVVLLTDHDVFDYPLVSKHAKAVFDARNRFPAAPNVQRL